MNGERAWYGTWCDVCGREKTELNRWWIIDTSRLADLPPYPILRLIAYNETDAIYSRHHLCGFECVQKFIDLWMQEQLKIKTIEEVRAQLSGDAPSHFESGT